MASNNTISQVTINGTDYDLLDANTLSAVSALDARVTALESSVSRRVEIGILASEAVFGINSSDNAFIDVVSARTSKKYTLTISDTGQLVIRINDVAVMTI